MAPKTIRKLIADALEDLTKLDYEKFCFQLLDRKEEPKLRRSQIEGKSYLVVADVLVSTFTESKAFAVTVEILREIDCHAAADALFNAAQSAGASDGIPTAEEEEHFVDKHRLQLIRRVYHVAPILDELFQRKIIQREVYNRIMVLSTSEDQMRELYRGPLQGGSACKDVFYEILEKDQPYLIEELKKMK